MPPKRSQPRAISYALLKVSEVRFRVEVEPFFLEPAEIDNSRMSVRMVYGTSRETKSVAVDLQIRYFSEKSDNGQFRILLDYITRTEFLLSDMAALNEDSDVENGILPLLVDIAVNTCRGMLVVRTLGTPYGADPLPLIDPIELIRKMKEGFESWEKASPDGPA